MVLFTRNQDYPTSVLTDLMSQDISSEDNIVHLISDSQRVVVHAFLLQNVSELLSNILSSSCQPSVILLPSSPPSTLLNLISLLYTGSISGLDRSQADHLTGLAIELGILITVEADQRDIISDDDSDDHSVVFTGKVNDAFFPCDVDSDFDLDSNNDSVEDKDDDVDQNFKQLKLEAKINGQKEELKLSFPKCRLNRDLSNIKNQKLAGFHGRIQNVYNSHSVGQYMGPYDQHERLKLDVQLPESNLNFGEYTEFQHDGEHCFELCLKSYKRYGVLEKIDAYRIEAKVNIEELVSDFDESENEKLFYTCQFETCRIPCPCPLCHLNQTQCSEHRIKHGDLFNEKEHAISIRSSEQLCKDEKFFQKSYILKYSGIPITCSKCNKDLLFHHSYHLKYHKKCRFCNQNWFKYKARTEQELKYLEKKEEAYFKTVCPHCDKQFCESYQVKRHIESEHTSATFKCNYCEKGFQSDVAEVYHE